MQQVGFGPHAGEHPQAHDGGQQHPRGIAGIARRGDAALGLGGAHAPFEELLDFGKAGKDTVGAWKP